MTKKQRRVYDWLKSHKGYLKKGLVWIVVNMPKSIAKDSSAKDFRIALEQARNDFKESYYPKGSTPPKKDIPGIKANTFKVKVDANWFNPNPLIFAPKVIVTPKMDPNNVLAIADLHLPFCRKGYLEHCVEIQKKYKCGTVVLIGDEVDLCGISQWEKDPDGFSAGTEADVAQKELKKWFAAFPTAYVCIGNHTARPFRMAKSNGIPKKFIKSYEEAWEAPKTWKWAEHWEFNNVLYTHGTGFSGANAAIRIAAMHRQNTVIGHIHSEAGIQYNVSKKDIIWGMQLGGAIDDKSYAAYYAKDQLKKSIVGCGVVLNGITPIFEAMKL